MFHIVISSYVKNPSALDACMAEHQDFVEAHHRTGSFLLSGPRVNRDGGIVVAQTATREELIDILEQDPLRKHSLIDYEIIGFALDQQALAFTEELFLGSSAVSRLLMQDAV